MRVRCIAARIATLVVAVIVALAVPMTQLRTTWVDKQCCCPDPDHCHCPDHKADSSPQPSLRACHNTERLVIAPELPAFRPPVVAVALAPAAPVAVVEHRLPVPHPAPPPTRPDAPS